MPVSPVLIASGAAPTVVATGVVLGDTCTIVETGTNGAASTTFTVDGAVQPQGPQVVITVTSAADVVVVASNDFPTRQAVPVAVAVPAVVVAGPAVAAAETRATPTPAHRRSRLPARRWTSARRCLASS